MRSIRRHNQILLNIRSTDPKLRARAASQWEDKKDLRPLLEVAENDAVPAVRVAVFAQLRKLGNARISRDLIDGFAMEGKSVQVTEMLGMWLDKKDSDGVFGHGIQALIRIGDGEAVAGLMKFYGNAKVSEELTTAMLTEFRRKPAAAVHGAIETLKAEPTRTPLIQLLGRLKQSEGVPFLKQLIGSAKHKYVINDALRSLADIGDQESVAAIAAALSHSEPGVRVTACECLGRLGEIGEPLVVKMLSDNTEKVRITAVQVLSQRGQSSFPVLIDFLKRETSLPVRFEAAVTLCQNGHEFARDEVLKELVRQADLKGAACSTSAIKQACDYLQCSKEYPLARTALHIPITQTVCGHSSVTGGGDYYAESLDSDASLNALRELCRSQGDFATEILKLVAARQSVIVSLSRCNFASNSTVDLARWRQEARQELLKRGHVPND